MKQRTESMKRTDKNRFKRDCENLTDRYIKDRIRKKTGIPAEFQSQEMINEQREQIKQSRIKKHNMKKVLKTNDYSIFNHIKGNRVLNENHIIRLKDSITNNGFLMNPILVNDKMEIIDGQHRLAAAKKAKSFVYYIITNDYTIDEVKQLNLNQKKWSKEDYMNSYAEEGYNHYISLKEFFNKNSEFTINSCVALCSNIGTSGGFSNSQQNTKRPFTQKENFEGGTWRIRDIDLAQEWVDRLRSIGFYFDGYSRSNFVSVMVYMFKNPNFNYSEFIKKLKNGGIKLEACTSALKYKELIEQIYNYRRSEKVNLRF